MRIFPCCLLVCGSLWMGGCGQHAATEISADHAAAEVVQEQAGSDDRLIYHRVQADKSFNVKENLVNIRRGDLVLQIFLNDEKPVLEYFNHKQSILRGLPVNFDYTYSHDIETAMAEIGLFVYGESVLLMLPVATEEYPAFHIIQIEGERVTRNALFEVRDSACRSFDRVEINHENMVLTDRNQKCMAYPLNAAES